MTTDLTAGRLSLSESARGELDAKLERIRGYKHVSDDERRVLMGNAVNLAQLRQAIFGPKETSPDISAERPLAKVLPFRPREAPRVS